jgi:hypothetical protein
MRIRRRLAQWLDPELVHPDEIDIVRGWPFLIALLDAGCQITTPKANLIIDAPLQGITVQEGETLRLDFGMEGQ